MNDAPQVRKVEKADSSYIESDRVMHETHTEEGDKLEIENPEFNNLKLNFLEKGK